MSSSRRNKATAQRVGRQRGFALLLVIWAISLLTVLAASLLTDTRTQTLLVRNSLENARAASIAEAGVTLALNGLLDSDPATHWPPDGRPRQLSYDGGTITVVMKDENGKIDLNLAPPELLAGLFATRGLDSDLRARLLAEIDRRRRQIAQSSVPIFAGRLPGNPNTVKAFDSVQELGAVQGLGRAEFERIRPFLTVYSQNGSVNPLTAPREVLEAVPGIDPAEVQALLAAQTASDNTARFALPPIPPNLAAYIGQTGTGAATVTATAVTAGGISFTREAVVGMTNTPLQPYQILEWRQPIDSAYAAAELR